VIREVSALGEITTVAGTGNAGFSGDGGPAPVASLNSPMGVGLDASGNLFIADTWNNRIRSSNGIIMTVAGGGSGGDGGPATSASFDEPRGVAVDTSGNLFVADWGNHRVSIFEADGTPLTNLYGDAQVMSKWGKQSVDANPDMMKAYRRVRNLEPLWRFCFPTAVDFNPATDEIIVADSQRNRLQVYKKVRDYQDFQANL